MAPSADPTDYDIEENLYGCYLLYCLNEKYKGHTYIGYTVNPLRRIKQHNKGVKFGGAKRTSSKGPWEMVLMIHGFPNSVSALKFEWAWQHPNSSRRLQHVRAKKSKETSYQYRVYVVSNMLRTGPWNKLPLVIRWLKQEYVIEFETCLRPPPHMPVVYGLVMSKKVDVSSKSNPQLEQCEQLVSSPGCRICSICELIMKDSQNMLICLNPKCRAHFHMTCLAEYFTNKTCILPVEGTCSVCSTELLWGDLIKYKKGCYRNLEPAKTHQDDGFDDSCSDDHWSAALHSSFNAF